MLTSVLKEDILHFKSVFLTEDFTAGIPTMSYAMKALSIAATADEQALQDVTKGTLSLLVSMIGRFGYPPFKVLQKQK